MKFHLLLFTFLFSCVLHASETETIFAIKKLKGDIQTYTDKNGSLLERPKKEEDGISNTIYIQRKNENGKGVYFINRTEVIPIAGEKSLTFLESYGDNNFLWTIYLDKKDEDGAFLVVYTCIKANGALGLVYSQVMSGKAYAQ